MSEGDTKKRTRSDLSSVSESDSSMNSTPVKPHEKKKQKPNEKEKDKCEQNEGMKEIQSELKKINKELKDVMKKKDIKEFIKDTIHEMKKELLSSTEKKIEILEFKMTQKDKEIASTEKRFEVLESQLFQKDKEIDTLKEDINKMRKDITDQKAKNEAQSTDFERYRRELRHSELKTDEYLNEYEQYNRRNNIRINGIEEEMFPKVMVAENITKISDKTPQNASEIGSQKESTDDKSGERVDSDETYAMKAAEQSNKYQNISTERVPENADQTTNILIKKINHSIPGLNLTTADIDISHRLGKKDEKRSRPIIAKFSSRLVKDKIMRNRKLFPKSVSVMDDLTFENYNALQSIKYKKPDIVQAAWYRNGKIFMKDHFNRISHVPYADFESWTKISWPKKHQQAPKKS